MSIKEEDSHISVDIILKIDFFCFFCFFWPSPSSSSSCEWIIAASKHAPVTLYFAITAIRARTEIVRGSTLHFFFCCCGKSITASVRRGEHKGQLTVPHCKCSATSHSTCLTTANPCKLLNNKSQSKASLGGQNTFPRKADRDK